MTPEHEFLLQIVAAVAWSDGRLTRQEIHLILEQLAPAFAPQEPENQDQLWSELYDRLFAHYDLEELLQQEPPPQHREWLLRLSYLLIQSGQNPRETAIAPAEQRAYRRLVEWLNLPPEAVEQIEQAAQGDVIFHQGQPLAALRGHIEQFFGGA
ncbi:urea ABC transporter ATP-binding protein UrtD [Gloeomargarita lithophora Alchichica-D10]|uniref:Urea ABC transporter ATP-binding protein UrtD n=1 Tax=Gloeomargarita lithophora Alchichica-D10 TaxID=1188229 RepID=A0A1J0AE03_9CYAN|nr:TerB family tellurite resistance protein [Gloeomargarita lithophora]APB34164.1 urea ABC transporter ATP-binding protein UrtD [Gloeomargarita lithophora Alchichica-D10]